MTDKRKYSDRAEYLKKAVDKRRKKIKLTAIAYKGGKCQFCGYNRCVGALEFHHLDPKGKDFGLGANGLTRSWEKPKKNWINAYSFAPTAIRKYMPVCCSLLKQLKSENEVNFWKPKWFNHKAIRSQVPIIYRKRFRDYPFIGVHDLLIHGSASHPHGMMI